MTVEDNKKTIPIPKINLLYKLPQDIKLERFLTIKKDMMIEIDNPTTTKAIDDLLIQNTDVFHIEGDKLTSCDILQHTIPLYSDSTPVNVKPYDRRSKWEKEEIENKVKKLIELGIVEPSRSPFNSPLHLVKKGTNKDGSIKTRLVVDFSKLNAITIPEHFPMYQIVDILDQLGEAGGATVFSTVDLSSGFYQVPLAPSCRHKTAFFSGYQHLQFVRMPMGLRSSSHSLNRLLRIALADLIGKILYVYVDDVLIFSRTIEEHIQRLQTLFSTLRKHNLKISAEKCRFLRTQIPFLGYIISNKGVLPDPDKIKPITAFPQPKNKKAIKSFLGMCGYYRRHIHQFADYAKPLNNLLKNDAAFEWSNECTQSFEYFKTCLSNPPILQFPDFTKVFQITTDASKVAVSAILSQGEHPNDLPIAYASRTLNDAETRYTTSEIELTAILFGIKQFKTYIGYQHFKIITDCKALQWLFQVKSPSSRLLKWKLKLAGYDYEIIHTKGTNNTVADCLSRYIHETQTPSINVLTRAKAKQMQQMHSPSYLTATDNRTKIVQNKEKPIDPQYLPTVIDSTDRNLTKEFPIPLIICDISDSSTLTTNNLDKDNINPGEVIYSNDIKKIFIMTQGISIDPNLLSKSLRTMKQICAKFEIYRILFERSSFHGTTREYQLIKNLISDTFKDSDTHFLFLTNKIIELTNLDEIS